MKRLVFIQALLLLFLVPTLACGPAALQVTPTPTKTPRRVQALEQVPTATPLVVPVLPTPTPTPLVPPTDTPTPVPPTDTPAPEPTPTDTPLPPTATPVPPPPPTFTPAPPPPPTEPPAPPPPTEPPPSQGPDVIVEFLNGTNFGPGDEIRIRFIVRDADGVGEVSWGVFTQNRTPLIGGEHNCNGTVDCSFEINEDAPPITGTFLVGADALDTKGNTTRGVGEVYVN